MKPSEKQIKMAAQKTKCCEQVREPGIWPRFHACRNTAIFERAGKMYCKIHDPEYKKEKAKIADVKFYADLDKRKENAMKIADYARLKAINGELLAACKAVIHYDESDSGDGVTMMLDYANAMEKCRSAIKKATS